MSVIDLNKLIKEALMLTRHELLRQGISLGGELTSDLPPPEGDAVGFQQTLLNLVMNARDATSAATEGPGKILVSSYQLAPDRIAVSVRDSGVGIDPSNIEQLFKPFFTTKSGGLGIGLAISRSSIEAHGGKLRATANEGYGTTFHFSLSPRQEP
ncbi:MAG: hypothetical protein QOJ99_2786 [Bryobacterales bacterium]|jgi:signal transduction histidine kinase|nr:hypothetical protein [Bryobacterales bacterium]